MSPDMAREAQGSAHPMDVEMSDVADANQLLACVIVETNDKIVIPAKDKGFWAYYYQTVNWETRTGDPSSWSGNDDDKPLSLKCKLYTPPPTHAFVLRNLPSPNLPEDVVGHIASFHDSAVHCQTCRVRKFDMNFFEECSAPSTPEQFLMVDKQVKQEGGFCTPRIARGLSGLSWPGEPLSRREEEDTLQNCIAINSNSGHLPEGRHFASCELNREDDIQKLIKDNEENVVLHKFIQDCKQDILNLKHISGGL